MEGSGGGARGGGSADAAIEDAPWRQPKAKRMPFAHCTPEQKRGRITDAMAKVAARYQHRAKQSSPPVVVPPPPKAGRGITIAPPIRAKAMPIASTIVKAKPMPTKRARTDMDSST
eukprot:6940181-Alexandrium_andersonii.AAC.1